jgi:hypothetical protein
MAMGYGGLFEWRIPPLHGQRAARYQLDPAETAPIPQGTPVVISEASLITGVSMVVPASGGEELTPGYSGVAVREYGPAFGYTRDAVDTSLVGSEALQLIHPGDMIQVIAAAGVKFCLRNGVGAFSIVGAPGAAGGPPADQQMIDISTPPSLGDGVVPSGTNDLTTGPWAVAGASAPAWGSVTEVGADYVEVTLGAFTTAP